jgi:hypothetical protein
MRVLPYRWGFRLWLPMDFAEPPMDDYINRYSGIAIRNMVISLISPIAAYGRILTKIKEIVGACP